MSASSWPFPAPVDDGAAAHLTAGIRLPPLALPATTGADITLSEQAGRAVVFIYPWTGRPGWPDPPGWDDIPGAHGSTPQAQGFAALYRQYAAASVAVFGLSSQDKAWQSELADRLQLPFPLLSDAGLAFARTLSLPTFRAGNEVFLKRLTLILEDGVIASSIYPVHPPHTHASEVFKALTGADPVPA